VVQQLAGVNVINFYSHQIFANSASHEVSSLLTLCMGGFDLLSIGISFTLFQYMRLKNLYLFGIFGVVALLGYIGAGVWYHNSWVSSTGVFGYMFLFQISLGPLTWVIVNQIVPSELMNLPVATHWIMTLMIGLFFPPMNKWVGTSNV
jgi:hypothetical protein